MPHDQEETAFLWQPVSPSSIDQSCIFRGLRPHYIYIAKSQFYTIRLCYPTRCTTRTSEIWGMTQILLSSSTSNTKEGTSQPFSRGRQVPGKRLTPPALPLTADLSQPEDLDQRAPVLSHLFRCCEHHKINAVRNSTRQNGRQAGCRGRWMDAI